MTTISTPAKNKIGTFLFFDQPYLDRHALIYVTSFELAKGRLQKILAK